MTWRLTAISRNQTWRLIARRVRACRGVKLDLAADRVRRRVRRSTGSTGHPGRCDRLQTCRAQWRPARPAQATAPRLTRAPSHPSPATSRYPATRKRSRESRHPKVVLGWCPEAPPERFRPSCPQPARDIRLIGSTGEGTRRSKIGLPQSSPPGWLSAASRSHRPGNPTPRPLQSQTRRRPLATATRRACTGCRAPSVPPWPAANSAV